MRELKWIAAGNDLEWLRRKLLIENSCENVMKNDNDANRYERMVYGIEMLSMCGFDYASDVKLSRSEIVEKLTAGYMKLARDAKHICNVFGTNYKALPAYDDKKWFKSMLDFINGKLDIFGVSIINVDSSRKIDKAVYKFINSNINLFNGENQPKL